MQRLLFIVLFSSGLNADDAIKCEEMPKVPVEEKGYIILKGDTVPARVIEPIVVYPIEDFFRIEE